MDSVAQRSDGYAVQSIASHSNELDQRSVFLPPRTPTAMVAQPLSLPSGSPQSRQINQMAIGHRRGYVLIGTAVMTVAGGYEMFEVLQVGGVTVLALPDSMPLYIDAAVMEPEYVIIGGGSRSMKIRIAPENLRRIPNAIFS